MRHMRIAVTGSEGHIGRAISMAAKAIGHDVVGIDLSGHEHQPSIDIRHVDALVAAFDGVDAVIHAAGLHAPHVGSHSDEVFRSVNVEGTSCVLEAITAAGVPRMVFTSTTAVFGPGSTQSTCARWIDETSPVAPRTIYHETKLAAEALVRRAAACGSVAAAIIRLGRCFPEPTDVMAVHRLCRGLDPRDAGTAHLHALDHAGPDADPLIISARTPFEPEDCQALGHSAPEIIELRCPGVSEAFRSRGWSLPDRIDRVYDSSRAQCQWKWRPQHDIWSVLGSRIAND